MKRLLGLLLLSNGALAATTPDTVNASFGLLRCTSTDGAGTAQTQLSIALKSSAAPSEPAITQDLDQFNTDAILHTKDAVLNYAWNLSTGTTNALGSTGTIGVGIWVYEDNTDGGGAGTNRRIFINLTGAAEASYTYDNGGLVRRAGGTGTISAAVMNKAGTYKVVPILYRIDDQGAESDTTPPTNAQVTGTAPEFVYDSDHNVTQGLAPKCDTFQTGRTAWVRVYTDAQSITTSVASNQRYGHQPTITVDLNSGSFARTGALALSKNLRIGPDKASEAVTTTLTKELSIQMTNDGTSRSTGTYNVDTLFPDGFIDTDISHHIRVGVGPRFGSSTTPSNEIPDVLSNVTSGNRHIPDSNDQAWVVFGTPASGVTKVDDYVVRATTAVNIASGFKVYTSAALTTAGIGTFNDSGYTTARSIFKRTGPTDTQFSIPRLEAFVGDAYGAIIPSKSFIWATKRHTDSANENSQTISTDSNGRVRWNYTIAATHLAFNRFKKSTSDDPNTPPLSISGSPVYPKNVLVTGNAFSGVNEPTRTQNSVFGVNSEIHFKDMWTGDLSQATIGSNGDPTGLVSRSKNLGSGGMRYKVSTSIGSNLRVTNATECNAKMVDGTCVVVTSDPLFGKTSVYSFSSSSVETSPVDDSTLNTSTGYSNSPANGFTIKDTSGDPRRLGLILSYADTNTAGNSFAITGTPGDPWSIGQAPNGNLGIVTDQNNFGYFEKQVTFVSINPELTLVATPENVTAKQGETRRFTLKVGQLLADFSFSPVDCDTGTERYYVFSYDPSGSLTLVNSPSGTALTSVGGSRSEFEGSITLATNVAHKVIMTCLVQSSRPTAPAQVIISQPKDYFDPTGLFK